MISKNKFMFFAALFSSFLIAACDAKVEEELPSTDPAPDDGTGGGGGGDGGGSTPLPIASTQGDFRILFVTDTKVNGTGSASGVGSGLTSFDALCESERITKGFGGIFKAMIGTTARRPKGTEWVLQAGKEYRRADQTTVIGVAADDVTYGTLLSSSTNALTNRVTGTSQTVWTGFNHLWEAGTANCSQWTVNTNDGSNLGNYGDSNIEDEFIDWGYTSFWGSYIRYNKDAVKMSCDNLHSVYCVQTRQPPIPGTQKILFKSTTAKVGGAGLTGFDAACSADAATKGLTGIYKAVVGARDPNGSGHTRPIIRGPCTTSNCSGDTGTSGNVDWPLLPNTVYVNEDRTFHYSKTNANAIFTGYENSLPVADTWFGMSSTWVPTTTNNCVDWTTSSSGGQGEIWNGGLGYCHWHQYLLCAEQ